jgi:hypothetical protein
VQYTSRAIFFYTCFISLAIIITVTAQKTNERPVLCVILSNKWVDKIITMSTSIEIFQRMEEHSTSKTLSVDPRTCIPFMVKPTKQNHNIKLFSPSHDGYLFDKVISVLERLILNSDSRGNKLHNTWYLCIISLIEMKMFVITIHCATTTIKIFGFHWLLLIGIENNCLKQR